MFLLVFVFPFLGLPLFLNLLGFQFLTCKSGSKDDDTTYESRDLTLNTLDTTSPVQLTHIVDIFVWKWKPIPISGK